MVKRQYNINILNIAIKRDNAILLENYEKTTKRTIIKFKCNCGQENSKACLEIVSRNGAFCKACTKIKATLKLQETRSKDKSVTCTIKSLNEVISRDNAILLETYNVITNNTDISFKCKCGKPSIKNSIQLIKVSGAFCKECTRITWTEKIKTTNLERYGVECTVHATHIKNQIIENNLEKYGVENIFESPIIREKIKQTILEKYGVEHVTQLPEIKEKTRQTCIERYGGDNPMCSEEVKEKIKQTNLERYGVESILQSPEFKEKIKQTCLERYGVEHPSQTPEFREKVKQTFIEHYGVDNPNKTSEVREKIKQTNLERYGVEFPSQCKEIQEKIQKNGKKYKEYTMPSGIIRKVQGYEPFALDELVKLYNESDIITDKKEIPRITYNINDKKKYYFPDIHIPSQNKIIEVKSDWTYKSKQDNIEEKANATKSAGYIYEIWVYDRKGNKTIK